MCILASQQQPTAFAADGALDGLRRLQEGLRIEQRERGQRRRGEGEGPQEQEEQEAVNSGHG